MKFIIICDRGQFKAASEIIMAIDPIRRGTYLVRKAGVEDTWLVKCTKQGITITAEPKAEKECYHGR